MIKKPKISGIERDNIAVLLSSGLSLRSIARSLKRSVSTICDEIKRNSINGKYFPITAQNISSKRNAESRKVNPLKNPKIYSYVFDKLRRGWSPEQIAGRLKRKNNGESVICHETIYRYIYSKVGREKGMIEYLVRHHYKRRKWNSRYLYRRGISDRTSIRLRPKVVDSRQVFGHWEADIVEGKGHSGGIQTTLERKTRYYQGVLIPKIDSEFGVKAQNSMLCYLPKKARQTITFDNGKENYNHYKLKRWLGIKTYFCDPYCSWQKGSNENHNGVLRRYIPKKASLEDLTQDDLDSIIEEINNRPRKCLNYEKPVEAFQKELKYIQTHKCSDST